MLNCRLTFGISCGLLCSILPIMASCRKPEVMPDPQVTVQVVRAHIGSISDVITADATLSPLAQAAISSRIAAPVKKFYVQRGSHVKSGELLATLENNDLSAAALDNEGAYTAAKAGYDMATQATVPEDYSKAQLELTQAKANLDLNQSIVTARTQLLAQGAIPGRDLDTAKAALVQAQAGYDIARQHFESVRKTSNKAALESARGQLDSAKGKYLGAQAQLGYTEIRSPIDGVVTDRPLFAGETAPAGTPLITVMQTSTLIAKLHIVQIQAQQLVVGGPATISVLGLDDPVNATVGLISPALDPGSTTVEVWLRVDNSTGLLKAGTPVHASISSRAVKNVLLIPEEALQTAADGGKFVMVMDANGTARKHPVTVGIQSGKEVQIASGISTRDNIITKGGYALDEGTKVKPGSGSDDKPDAGKGGDEK